MYITESSNILTQSASAYQKLAKLLKTYYINSVEFNNILIVQCRFGIIVEPESVEKKALKIERQHLGMLSAVDVRILVFQAI